MAAKWQLYGQQLFTFCSVVIYSCNLCVWAGVCVLVGANLIILLKKSKLSQCAMATVRIPKQKVILCGDYGVGKSSLFRRFTNDTFITDTDRKSTLGLDHIDREYNVGEKQIKVIQVYN